LGGVVAAGAFVSLRVLEIGSRRRIWLRRRIGAKRPTQNRETVHRIGV